MEKAGRGNSSVILSKAIGESKEKVIFSFTALNLIKAFFCFLLCFAKVFSNMTPFGLAFYSAIFRPECWVLTFFSSLLGIFVHGGGQMWVYALTLVSITALLAVFDLFKNVYWRSGISAFVYALLSVARCVGYSFVMYDIFAALLESIILGVGVYVFSYGFPCFLSVNHRNVISSAESLCVNVFITAAILGFQSFPTVFGFHLSSVLSVMMIFMMSMDGYTSGALVLGILLGIAGGMQSGVSVSLSGTYAFGALLAGSMKKYGRIGVILGFVIANTASSLLFSTSEEIVISLYDSFAASIIFIIMPQKVVDFFSSISAKAAYRKSVGDAANEKMKNAVSERLAGMSKSFRELSEVYSAGCSERIPGRAYLKMMLSQIEPKVCVGCPNRKECFDENGGVVYSYVCSLLEYGIKRKNVSAVSFPDKLKNTCHRCDSLAQALGTMFDIMITEKQWLGKINESRRLISDQLGAVSDAIEREYRKSLMKIDTETEDKLWAELDKIGITPSSITVERGYDDDYDIAVGFKGDKIFKETKSKVADCITSLTAIPAVFSSLSYSGIYTVYNYCPAGAYSADFGYASKAKNGESLSGDSFNVIFSDRKNVVMALSDGMGSGKDAAGESKTTIQLLEKFLSAGFDCDTAVKLINSSLLLKSSKDTFSTVDICSIDLYDSTLTFTKLGASASYIKCGDKITSVRARSLPAGILREIEIEKHMLSIDSDTLVVLMSDGVADIELKSPENEGWIEKELLRLDTSNPQIIAAKLLETAYKLENKVSHDDMTVLCACISKNEKSA